MLIDMFFQRPGAPRDFPVQRPGVVRDLHPMILVDNIEGCGSRRHEARQHTHSRGWKLRRIGLLIEPLQHRDQLRCILAR